MADNVQISAGTGDGAVIATDDIGPGVHYQILKLAYGALDSATIVSTTNGLPVQQQGTWNIATVTAVTGITNALPAGTNAIGKLAANSGVDIGDVDVNSVVPGTGATNLGKAEDAGHTTGDVGVMMLGVRNEGADDFSGTDKDYIPIALDAKGHVFIRNSDETFTVVVGSITAGDNNIGNVDIASAIPAGTNLIGDVDIAPRTTGGWSVGNFTSGDTYTALTNGAQVVKGSAGKFGGYYIYNPNSAVSYVLVYNIAAASVTVGTSTAKLIFCIPANSGANLEILAGIPFDTAIAVAAATTGGGNTAPTTALEAMIWYK